MKISNLNRINPISMEDVLGDVKEATGTFEEILTKTLEGKIRPVVEEDEVVGLWYEPDDTNTDFDDACQRLRFERRFTGVPVYTWFTKSLQLRADGYTMDDIYNVDYSNDGIVVILKTGEPYVVEEPTTPEPKDEEKSKENGQPCLIEIQLEDFDSNFVSAEMVEDYRPNIAEYLRNTYDRYLSGKYPKSQQFDLDYDECDKTLRISDIKWGRRR